MREDWQKGARKILVNWEADAFSLVFILDVVTLSQQDHKLFSTTYILCSKKFCNKKMEGSPLTASQLVELQSLFLSSYKMKISSFNYTVFWPFLMCTSSVHKFEIKCFKAKLQRSFSTCFYCVFKVITLVGSNQRNFFENATACSKSTLKTTVTT